MSRDAAIALYILSIVVGIAVLTVLATAGIVHFIGLRAEYMLRGLRTLLAEDNTFKLRLLIGRKKESDPASKSDTLERILSQPAIAAIGPKAGTTKAGNARLSTKQRRNLPSYISGRAFSRAVLDAAIPDAAGRTSLDELKQQLERYTAPVDRRLYLLLLDLLNETRGEIDQVRERLTEIYDDHMRHVRSWFRTHVAWISAGTAAVVAMLALGSTILVANFGHLPFPGRNDGVRVVLNPPVSITSVNSIPLPTQALTSAQQRQRLSSEAARAVISGIGALPAVVPALAGVAGVGEKATTAVAAGALSHFTDSFTDKLGGSLGQHAGDGISSSVSRLVDGISSKKVSESDPKLTQNICDSIKSDLNKSYEKLLERRGVLYPATVADDATAEAAQSIETACTYVTNSMLGLKADVKPKVAQEIFELAIYTALLEAENDVLTSPQPTPPTSAAVTTSPPTGTPNAASPSEMTTQTVHVVSPGESLWTIARSTLASSSSELQTDMAWRDLWQTNLAVVGADPNFLVPGTKLVVGAGGQPEKTAPAAGSIPSR